MALRFTRLALRFPHWTLFLVAVATALAGAGATRLRSISYLEGTLPPEDPELARYTALEREFGSERIAVLAVGCGAPRPCQDVFEADVLDLIASISHRALALRGVEDVRSLATARFLVRDGRGLGVEQMRDPSNAATAGRLRALVSGDPTARGTIVARDLRTASVVVAFDPALGDGERGRLTRQLVAEARREAQAAGFEVFASGNAVFGAFTTQYVRRDLAILTPVMIALLAALLLWIFRDALSVGLALCAVAAPSAWVFGLMGWTDRPVTPISSTLPILILVIGITDAVHFLVRYRERRGADRAVEVALCEVAREVGPPTTVTAATAALGFLSFLAGPIPIVRDFGVFAAIGIVGGWLLTFTLVPVIIARRRTEFAIPTPTAFELANQLLAQLREFTQRRAALVVAGFAALAALALVGLARVVPENDTLKLIGQGDYLAESARFIRERLRPPASIEVTYEVPEGSALTEPAHLGRLGAIEALLEQETGIEPVVSLLPILRLANRTLTGDESLPTAPGAAAQLVLLAEAAGAEDLYRVMSPDRRVARLSGAHEWGGSRDVQTELARLRRSVGGILGDESTWSITGTAFIAVHMGDVILRNQLASFTTAFLTIFAVIFLFVRSLSLGALGMVPNLLPIAVILGFMGFAHINLDVATAMIASIVLGISVDDTVYFLVHYRHARRGGSTARDAVAYTLAIAGKPALFCGAALALGFFVLAFSSFQSLSFFGLLSGVGVLFAAISELLLMPALLELTAGRRDRA